MRIMFDMIGVFGGGMERQVADLTAGLVARGHDVLVVVNKGAPESYLEKVRAGGSDVKVLGRMHRLDARVLTDLLGIVRRFDPDVVVAENFNATLWGRLAGIIRGTGVVVAEHSSDTAFSGRLFWTNRVLGRFTHAVVGCARAQTRSLIADGHPARAIVTIHNAVDTAFFRRDPEKAEAFRARWDVPRSSFVIGLVAAHRREKRHDRFVALAEALAADDLDFVACEIGGGPLLDDDREAAARSVAKGRMRVVGPQPDVVAAYSACDIVVLLSDSVETFPLCFLEAQACERPVAGMRVGGVEETFEPGVSGFLVEQGDVAAMATVVRGLAADPEMRERMGREGRAFVETHFAPDDMVSAYEDVLKSAAAQGRRHR